MIKIIMLRIYLLSYDRFLGILLVVINKLPSPPPKEIANTSLLALKDSRYSGGAWLCRIDVNELDNWGTTKQAATLVEKQKKEKYDFRPQI